jgi:hypothetical protein
MGGTPSKEEKPLTFTPDWSKATLTGEELKRQTALFTAQAQEATKKAATVASTAAARWYLTIIYGMLSVIGITLLVIGVLAIHDLIVRPSGGQTFILQPLSSTAPPAPAPAGPTGPVAPQKSTGPVSAGKPPLLGNIFNFMSGSGSGDLISKLQDATTSSSVSAASAPLSSANQGNYGVQWWMFVKDWNYGYGKEKSVVFRPDATNSAVANPNVTLHPTDNTLRIAISIFPAEEGGAGKTEPAPAGHSGSSDDVYVCEVPNIPLQSWFSVSMTVFERNLDVYIDGKLVKSCFLSGVPKPAVGDIQLTKDGGFSGYMCNLYHYPRMLTPDDAIAFYTAGTPCSSQTVPSGTAAATGYSVKFGVYDTVGKEVQEYTF